MLYLPCTYRYAGSVVTCNERQVKLVPFISLVAVRVSPTVKKWLYGYTPWSGGLVSIIRLLIYIVSLVPHSNVTVSLTYTYCVSGTVVILAPKII